MANDKDFEQADEAGLDANAPESAPEAQAPEQAGALGERIAALEAENAELKDRVLRTMAEMENLRRRTEREVKDASQYAVTKFARDVLGVGDNLRRALDAVGAEARANADAGLQGLLDGVEMTERELLNVMERHGIVPLDPKGERFDPNLHQAMFEVEDATQPAGTVVQVFQAGYRIGDRVLRPALVGVSKGGPRPGQAAPQETTLQEAAAGEGQARNGEGAQREPQAADDRDRGTEGAMHPGARVNRTA